MLSLKAYLISIILWETAVNSDYQAAKYSGFYKILAAILAPWAGGEEYIGLITNFN